MIDSSEGDDKRHPCRSRDPRCRFRVNNSASVSVHRTDTLLLLCSRRVNHTVARSAAAAGEIRKSLARPALGGPRLRNQGPGQLDRSERELKRQGPAGAAIVSQRYRRSWDRCSRLRSSSDTRRDSRPLKGRGLLVPRIALLLAVALQIAGRLIHFADHRTAVTLTRSPAAGRRRIHSRNACATLCEWIARRPRRDAPINRICWLHCLCEPRTANHHRDHHRPNRLQ